MVEHCMKVAVDPWFEALASLTNVGVLMFDPAGAVQFAGGIARELLRCGDDSELQQRVQPLAQSVAAAGAACRDGAALAPPVQQREYFTVESDEGPRRLAAAAHAIKTDGCVGVLVLLWDCEVEDLMERDLRLASRYRSVSQVYQAMAHDLRSPVASILISSNVLRSMLEQPPESAKRVKHVKWLEAIEEGVQTLDQSLHLLLGELVAADEFQQEFDLRNVVEAVRKLIVVQATKWNIALEAKLSERPAILTGLASRIKLALLNIATNGIQAMPDGGLLRLELAVDANEALVTIADTGPGIPKRLLTKIFDRYFTTKQSGTGIGLYIAKDTIESHGGRIEVRSTKGKGTVFEITFPLCPGPS